MKNAYEREWSSGPDSIPEDEEGCLQVKLCKMLQLYIH